MTKLLLIEDNQLLREALTCILSDFEIVGEAQDGCTAIQMVRKTKPDMILLDLSLPKMYGIKLLKIFKSHYPQIKIIVLTLFDSVEYVKECINAQADAYVLKDEGQKKLKEVIRRVLAGETYISPGLTRL
jgi:two-component system response regulator NreC